MVDNYLNLFKLQPLVCTSIFISLLPLILIISKKAYNDKVFYIFMIYVIYKIVIDLIMFHYAALRFNTLIFFNISIPIRYALLGSMFYLKIESKTFKKLIAGSIILNFIFFIWDLFQANPEITDLHNHELLLYSVTIECVLMIFWILIYFKELIQLLKINNLLTYPFFWVCSGLLLYYSSFVFIAPVFHYTFKWGNWLDIGLLEYIPNVFEIVSMLFVSIGIYNYSNSGYAKQ